MRIRASVLLVVTCLLIVACKERSSAPPVTSDFGAIVGRWNGGGWGYVVMRSDGTGSYTDTYKTGPGEMKLEVVGPRTYKGSWGESEQRHGTLEVTVSDDGNSVKGTWEPDPSSTIGTKSGGTITWNREAK
jgi:hypothetical protein